MEEPVPAEEDSHRMPEPVKEPQEKLSEGHLVVLGVPSVELRVVEKDVSGDDLLQQSKEKDRKRGPGNVEQLKLHFSREDHQTLSKTDHDVQSVVQLVNGVVAEKLVEEDPT